MARRLKITLAARAVIARGFVFSPREGSFADVDVALDEILSLPPPPEPLVLRVTATGGDAAERARVEGDWLCDATRGEPRRIPAPVWSYNKDAAAWATGRSWLEAWETCEDARWMLHAAAKVGVDRRLVVRAACACARTALDRIPAGEERPRRAIETAEAWTRGEATLDQVQQAANAAYASCADAAAAVYAADDDADAAAAVYAAANAANAVYADAVYAAYAAFYADAVYAADADAASYASNTYEANARRRALTRLAEVVRGEAPTLVVLRATLDRTR